MNKKKSAIKSTGERLVPKLDRGKAYFYEHLSRYLFASQLTKGKVVLDAGCGTGYGSFILSEYGKAKRVYGIDITPEAINYAQQNYSLKNINYLLDDVEELKHFPNHSLEVIVCFEVIEHLQMVDELLQQSKRVLKEDGFFVVSTPNKHTSPKGNPFHKNEIYPKDFLRLLKSYYKEVDLYQEGFEFSHVIKKDRQLEVSLEEDFIKDSYLGFLPPGDIANSEFVLAVCSDYPIPSLQPVLMNSRYVSGFDLRRGFVSLTEQFNLMEFKINALQQELAAVQASKFFKIRGVYHKIRRWVLSDKKQ
ncbi:MAG: Glycosyltransferase, group 2 family protein [Candidatus Daviesbacteria bacterium GW2011_GWA1_41_61]|uniref:Glycosyltransferase, group 2 family protein n=1 Tax=Candidatus Daviesbacteria bacterium GW2011_GWA2_40_9 TaxID=1618424 RepID=A0A0G0WHA8_9BACT|nr:MAG: Glycosyltransferase, group 2 family protein [Candidatus Daviesbacteria bacterium GW2011_GWC1_40_9]KKR83710.1 MAG: Glycosyltransferase, group 2 family protein [Candidatus Daviesbacteria bacterium GW2011_GWA2_40_9]KKR93695.1 MAG: Glycosyltransferase, group 2 family protein [Candidatus Daviesbacteria bacterium GW2011_GWB1_41_15]KKS15161.1 MAG: Glycosyltransferase, group 2 family protein [Candidatus Daviesbacteria bacterium GW2011_GWA1_41_61]